MQPEFNASSLLAAFDDDVDDVRHVVRLVCSSLPRYLADLRSSIQSGDRLRAAALAHTIRGTVGNVHADHLAALVRDVERAARGRAPLTAEDVDQVDHASWRLIGALDGWVNGLARPPLAQRRR